MAIWQEINQGFFPGAIQRNAQSVGRKASIVVVRKRSDTTEFGKPTPA